MTVVPGLLLLAIATLLRMSHDAVRSSSRIRLRHLVDKNTRGSLVAALHLEHPAYLRAVFFAWECAFTLTGALLVASGLFARSVAAVLVSGLILSALSYAALNALAGSLARSTQSHISDALARIVDPLVRLSTRVFPALTRSESAAAAAADATEEGEREAVEELIEEGVREGIGDSEDMKLVTGVVELRDTRVREIMVPRQDVFALPAELPPYEIARRIASSGYSRVPIYSGDLDAIAGIFHVLDVLKLGPHDLPPLRPVVTAGTNDRCSDLLLRMLRQHAHICIVTDETGHTAGIVTLEDLLEEIVGEIQDEFDEPAPATASGQAVQ